jgi:3-keto-5-aminohexanoate cleavage enzyme
MDLIVNFTPTGLIPTKAMTKYVPITVNEIVEDIHQALEIGITMVHLHARNEETEAPSYQKDLYKRVIEKVRKISDELVICVSLSGRNVTEFDKRVAPLNLEDHLKPDMGSLTLSSLNFNKQASINSPDMIQRIAQLMRNNGILAELEAFDVGMINYAKYLERKGLLVPPHYFNLIVGNIACAQANLLHLGIMVNDLPPNSFWSVGGVGQAQMIVNSISIAAGGGVRVGLEDNIWLDKDRKKLCSNIELLQRIRVLCKANDRQVMKAATLRKLLNLEKGKGKYGRSYR